MKMYSYHYRKGYGVSGERIKSLLLTLVLTALLLSNAFQYYQSSILLGEVKEARAQAEAQQKIAEDLGFQLRAAEAQLEEKEALLREAEDKILALNTVRKNRFGLLAIINGNGVVIPVEMEVRPGEGRFLLDVEGVVYFVDTQSSLLTALKAAEAATSAGLAGNDVILRVENPYAQTLALAGKSAGASFAVAMIASLQGREIKSDVLLTGEVKEDGSIGPVSGVYLKALAAKDAEARILLVPKGQGVEVDGLEVVEVSDIDEAAAIMLK
jgi:hypothetical protein